MRQRGTQKNGAQVNASHFIVLWNLPLGKRGLFQNHVDEGGYVAHVDFTVAVDVAHLLCCFTIRKYKALKNEQQKINNNGKCFKI